VYALANSVLTAWFNNAAYTANGPGLPGGIGPGGADGNVGRDTLIGPGLKDMDAVLSRNITFERGVVFQFRADFTNVLNWVNLSNPNLREHHVGSQATITSATATQRVIQLGGRLTF
jgi:hypothetical protein